MPAAGSIFVVYLSRIANYLIASLIPLAYKYFVSSAGRALILQDVGPRIDTTEDRILFLFSHARYSPCAIFKLYLEHVDTFFKFLDIFILRRRVSSSVLVYKNKKTAKLHILY